MEAGGFGALRSALHRRPSAPLYKKICALLSQDDGSPEDDAQRDYARAIMDRTWPDALRTAHLTPWPDPHERHELMLARAWHVEGSAATAERLATHDLPPPPTIKLLGLHRRDLCYQTLNPIPLLAALPRLPEHLDLSARPLEGNSIPALLDALRARALRRVSLDGHHLCDDDLNALLCAAGPRDLAIACGPWRLKALQAARPTARVSLIIHDHDQWEDRGADLLEPLLNLRWPLHALDTSQRLDDARLISFITTPGLTHLTATWTPGAQVDEVLAALAGSGCRAALEVHATPLLIERALAGALPLPRHSMTLSFRNHHDDQLFDQLQRRYSPGALTCASEGARRYAMYEDEDDYDRHLTAWHNAEEAWRGRGEGDPDAAFARTQRALSGGAKGHIDQALDEQTRLSGARQRLRR